MAGPGGDVVEEEEDDVTNLPGRVSYKPRQKTHFLKPKNKIKIFKNRENQDFCNKMP